MSFAVSRDQGTFEWAGASLGSIFCQKRNILSPRMWRMLFDVIRFNQFALDLLIHDDDEEVHDHRTRSVVNHVTPTETIGQYLEREGYSDAFRDDYLLPMTAAVWSTSPDKCLLDFPAVTLVRFMWNHHLLSTLSKRPEWLTLKDGSRSYISAVMKGFPPNHLFLNTAVRHITNDDDGRVLLHLENGKTETFDHVVLATHGDQALSILKPSATAEEASILSCFQTSQNEAVLHSDLSHMPARRKAWSSWNYMTKSSPLSGKANVGRVSLTYNMNILQHIPRHPFGDVLVTLNPLHQPRRDKVHSRYVYSHPLYTPSAVRAQKLLRNIQNTRGISYAGAWTKYGFHEDGFSSGLYVAQEHLGAKLPFEFKDSTYSRGRRPRLSIQDLLLRLIILIIQVFVVQILERFIGKGKETIRPYINGGAKQRRANGKLKC